MNLCNIGQDFRYELEKLIRIFLPFEKIAFYDVRAEDARMAVMTREITDGKTVLTAELLLDGEQRCETKTLETVGEEYEKDCERVLAVLLYNCFCSITGYTPEWGILTGVRPAKLFSRLCDNLGDSGASDYFKNELKVSENKISLCREAVSGEKKITELSAPNSFSLYLSVPFCPTRCHYCSFVSHSVESAKKLIPIYVDKLCEELRATALTAKKNGLQLETVYIGGGTPTTLDAKQLERVMSVIRENFDLSFCREYTVEAGRPDTVTPEKLAAIKSGGATRISINPQTMCNNVLEAIGRAHTAEQTVEAFQLARSMGFDNINMDLIAGLPTDTQEGFADTLQRVVELNPESVTVHSLSMKRASSLSTDGRLPELEAGQRAAVMVEHARKTLSQMGIVPYYMYRQSKTVGNLENVGYAKKGYECLYNVYIMDETHTILACGASAVTKLREPNGSYIERIFNFKYPYEYIDRFETILERKHGIDTFYKQYPIADK